MASTASQQLGNRGEHKVSFNKIIVVGNLGRDPELRYTPQGTPNCTFSLASNERRKTSAGEQQDITTWFRVTVWGKRAETVAQYLSKGRSVYVEGRLHVEEWTDRDGKPRFTLEVNASDVQFIGSANEGERDGIPVRQSAQTNTRAAAASATSKRAPQPTDDEEDSIPF
ncbi:MAG: single-stranded DNA-binding protein [Acidobacteria bacterium]|nr:MAG: single-stranded DNA-binding protein [Acidobacteriota bacterium]